MKAIRGNCAPLFIWYVDLDASADIRAARHVLSAAEQLKADRFRFDRDRNRYVMGRAALRQILAGHLGCSPSDLYFAYGTHGKPFLMGSSPMIDFNVAHSGAEAVIALTHNAAIGVDIEIARRIPDVTALASEVFSPIERREFDGAADPSRAFLNGWTRKEAYLKAIGIGCSVPLTEVTVSLSGRPALLATAVNDSLSDWNLTDLPHPRAIVAVALGPALGNSQTN